MRAGRGVVELLLLLLLSSAGRAGGSEDIVVGCGGFVKSDVEINYSLIEVSRRAWPGAGCATSGQALCGSTPFPSSAEGRVEGGEGLLDPGSPSPRLLNSDLPNPYCRTWKPHVSLSILQTPRFGLMVPPSFLGCL